MTDLKCSEWRKLYEEALLETDDKRALIKRIQAAKAAVVTRLKIIQIGPENSTEASALEGALRTLMVLGNGRLEGLKSKTRRKAVDQFNQVESQID